MGGDGGRTKLLQDEPWGCPSGSSIHCCYPSAIRILVSLEGWREPWRGDAKGSFAGSQGLLCCPRTSRSCSYPLEEGEHYIPLQGLNIWCFVKGFSCGQVGHERGDGALCPGCDVPEEGMTVNLRAPMGGVRNGHRDRGIHHWESKLPPSSCPADEGRPEVPD